MNDYAANSGLGSENSPPTEQRSRFVPSSRSVNGSSLIPERFPQPPRERQSGREMSGADGTDREREERCRILAAELREAERHKNEFLAALSHELRNPLAVICNSLAILGRTALGGEQAKRALETIERQVGQLSHMVDDLLDITRIGQNQCRLQPERLALNQLVWRMIDEHRTLFERNGVGLETEIPDAPIFLTADESRTAQVVAKLLQNAAKFTGRGGRTRVSLQVDPTLRQAVLRVADTGIGMTAEMLSRLFQPFMQADMSLDRNRGGLGLGLALIKGLVEMQGGKVSAFSDGPGQGTEFTVRLPLESTVVESFYGAPPTTTPIRRVLIIDDNIDLAESLRELLELSAHEVAVSYSGCDGLLKAKQFQPEVILCDIGLPGMDGYEVARAIRADETFKEVMLVALTGYALPKDKQQASEAGFQQHLAKPVDYTELETLLAQAGRNRGRAIY